MYIHCYLLLLLAFLAAPLHAGAPTEEIRTVTERVLNTVRNGGGSRDVRAEMDARFDWPSAARGCLGKNWSARTPAEQKEFIALFSEFLSKTYANKIVTYYKEYDSATYGAEKLLEDRASVPCVLKTKDGLKHPVEYRLLQTGGGWKVYDVLIENLSLVKNYRDQFNAIIARNGYEGLLQELRAKVSALK